MGVAEHLEHDRPRLGLVVGAEDTGLVALVEKGNDAKAADGRAHEGPWSPGWQRSRGPVNSSVQGGDLKR